MELRADAHGRKICVDRADAAPTRASTEDDKLIGGAALSILRDAQARPLVNDPPQVRRNRLGRPAGRRQRPRPVGRDDLLEQLHAAELRRAAGVRPAADGASPRRPATATRSSTRSAPEACTDPAVRARMDAVFADVAKLPHVPRVISPYAARPPGKAISASGKIAFATVVFNEKANLLPKSAPERVVEVARAAGKPGLQMELGGQAIEATEQAGFGLSTGRRPAGCDRRAAADVRLAGRDGPADRHRAVRPRHGARRDRAVHARRRHPQLLLRARRDDRAGGRDRLRAVHPHPLPRGLPNARARRSRTRASRSSRRSTPPGARSCSPAPRS